METVLTIAGTLGIIALVRSFKATRSIGEAIKAVEAIEAEEKSISERETIRNRQAEIKSQLRELQANHNN